MKKRKKAILIAFVLGDGYLEKRGEQNKTGTIKFCHSVQQKEYLQYKVDLLHSLIGGKKPVLREYEFTSFNKTWKQVRAEKAHRYFRVLRKWLYPNKYDTKYLKHLTPEALAIWYMDDGSLIANNRNEDGTVRSARTNLHLCTTKEIALKVCEYFQDTWEIKFTTFKENGGTYSIRCFHQEGRKFHELIHPYVIPSMLYKQRFYYDKSAQPLSHKIR